jgi:hypothetical protein
MYLAVAITFFGEGKKSVAVVTPDFFATVSKKLH